MKIKKTILVLLSFLILTESAWAGDVKSCELALVPKASAVIQETFRHQPKLAEKFISVLIEEHNLFLGSALLNYFDQALVKHGYLRTEGGRSFTALNSSKFAKQNKMSLKKFETADKLDQVRIATEIWEHLQEDLELDKPELVNGKNVFIRIREKASQDGIKGSLQGYLSEVRFDGDLLDERVAKLVELRSTLLDILNQPGGRELIRAFIVSSLPFHARLLSELQVQPASGLGLSSMIIGGSLGAGSIATFGLLEAITLGNPIMAVSVFVGGLGGGVFGLEKIIRTVVDRDQRSIKNVSEKQCEACALLAKGVRKQLERNGLTVNATLSSQKEVEVRSLELSKPPMLSYEDKRTDHRLELQHPIQLGDINNFGQSLIHTARELMTHAEAIETSYESGIPYLTQGKNLSVQDLRHRMEFRLEEIQKIQPYLQGMIEQTEKTGKEIFDAIEYIKENVDTFAHKDQHMNLNVANAMEAQARTLNVAENALFMAKQKLVTLSSGIIRESNLINEIFLRKSEQGEDSVLLHEYFSFLAEKQDLNVEEVMRVLSINEIKHPKAESKELAVNSEPKKGGGLPFAKASSLTLFRQQKKDFINSSLKQAELILGRKIDMKDLENIIYESNRNNISLNEALDWFKAIDKFGSQPGYRTSVYDDNLIKLLPLLSLHEVNPKEIMERFFALDLLGSKSRDGWTIYDSAVARLVVTSFVRDLTVDVLVGRFFEFVDLLKENYPTLGILSDNEYADLVKLSFDYPAISPKDLLDLEVQLYRMGKVGDSVISDGDVIKLMESILQSKMGQLPTKSELFALIQEFYSLKGRFKVAGTTNAQIARIVSLANSRQKKFEDVANLFEVINAHTKNDAKLSLDILELLLNKAAAQNIEPSKESRDILEALFFLTKRGHKLLPSEFLMNK